MTPPAPTTPAALAAWRTRMNLSRRKAAPALGCSYNALARYEAPGNTVPRLISLAAAALEAKLPGLPS